jgi:hypothetical protein
MFLLGSQKGHCRTDSNSARNVSEAIEEGKELKPLSTLQRTRCSTFEQ